MAEDYPFSPTPDPATSFREAIVEAVEFEHQEEQAEQSALAMVFVIGIILGLAGFGMWRFLGGLPSDNRLTIPSVPLSAELQKDPNIILAAVGGTVVSPYGVEIYVPAGALSKDKKIEIERVASGAVTDLYRLKPEGLKFLKPVAVAIPYKKGGLKSGEEPKDILLEYWFIAGDRKQSLKYEVDASIKKLRTTVTQF
jgi:hypothetical protein